MTDTASLRPVPGTVPLPGTCRWCGFVHGPRCPAVAAIEFHPDGTVKRVEFVAQAAFPVDYSQVRLGPIGLVPDGRGGMRAPNPRGEMPT